MNRSDIYTWVHTWWGRDGVDLPFQKSLAESDMDDWIVHRQPQNRERNEYYLAVLRRAIRSGKRFMLRIEDDAVVNKYIIHNTISWRAVKDPKFGVGFLSTCDRVSRMVHPFECEYPNTLEYKRFNNHFGGGWIAATDALQACMPDIEAILMHIHNHGGFGPSTSVSDGMVRRGYRCFIHSPAIVKVDVSIPSHRFGEKTDHYGEQPFDPDFRRSQERDNHD